MRCASDFSHRLMTRLILVYSLLLFMMTGYALLSWGHVNTMPESFTTADKAENRTLYTVGSMGLSGYEMAEGLVELVANWSQTVEALEGILGDPAVRARLGEAMVAEYEERLARQARAFEEAGWEGSVVAGVEAGRLAMDIFMLGSGVGATAKATAKLSAVAAKSVAQASAKLGEKLFANIRAFTSTEMNALRGAGLSEIEIAQQVKLNGDIYLFRGTSPGWLGSPGAQATAVSATTDPYIATIFALEARAQGGQALLIYGGRSQIGTFDMGNWMALQEREVGVLLSHSDFVAKAPYSIPVDTARQILKDMGLPDLPYSVVNPTARKMLIDEAPKMTPMQIHEFLQRAGQY
jgi:hypothetical protein